MSLSRIKEFFRRIRGSKWINRARISQTEALAIATSYCRNNQLPWQEPVHIIQARGSYTVWTNFGARGNNRWIRIDAQNGEIQESGVTSH